LREQADHLDTASLEVVDVPGELAKLAAAVGSPGAAMEDEQQASVREQIRQRPDPPLLVR
jgi:hypothetical protein